MQQINLNGNFSRSNKQNPQNYLLYFSILTVQQKTGYKPNFTVVLCENRW